VALDTHIIWGMNNKTADAHSSETQSHHIDMNNMFYNTYSKHCFQGNMSVTT
jgi:hypothetical protein